MARPVSLVARRDKSAVLLSSAISSELTCSRSSSSFSRSAWYACKHRHCVQTRTCLTCCRVPPAHERRCSTQRLCGQGRSLQGRCHVRRQITRKRLFYLWHRPITALIQTHDIPIIVRCWNEGAGRVRSSPRSTNLSMQIGKKGQAPMRRWRPSAQETLVELASTRLGLLLGWPINMKFIDSASHHLQQLLILQRLGRLIDAHCLLLLGGRVVERRARSAGGSCYSLTASSPGAGARSGGSGWRQGLACLHFLLQIELWAPRVQTPLCLGSSGTRTAGLTRENPVHKQGFRERSVRSGKRSQ